MLRHLLKLSIPREETWAPTEAQEGDTVILLLDEPAGHGDAPAAEAELRAAASRSPR